MKSLLFPTVSVIALSGHALYAQANGGDKLVDVMRRSTTLNIEGFRTPFNIASLSEESLRPITVPDNYTTTYRLRVIDRPVNLGIAAQLSALPIASPAAGVILREDPSTGLSLPSAQSLGPILTERAETIGKGRLYLGYTRQQFRFKRLDDRELGNFTILDKGGLPTNISQGGVAQTSPPLTLTGQVALGIDQNVAFITYGLTNRIEVSTALTWIRSGLGTASFDARIYNTGDPTTSGDPGTCWCAFNLGANRAIANLAADPFGRVSFTQGGLVFQESGSSTGIGDTTLRIKGTVLQRQRVALAVGTDFRLPTGDELNYHGAGAAGFKPFAALSLYTGNTQFSVSPHFNIGYQFNGDSLLAGDPFTDTKGSLPNQFFYSAGATFGISRNFTFVADILGTRMIDTPRLIEDTTGTRGNRNAVVRGLVLSGPTSYNMTNGAFGIKVKTVGNLVLSTNLLVAFDESGLRDKLVPLFGLGYTF